MQRNRTLLLAAVVAAAGLLGPTPTPADAAPATIVVTTTSDVVNAGDGLTSLREALVAAQNDGITNTVTLGAGATYTLDDCAGGDLNYSADEALVLDGNGSTIDQTCAGQRVLNVATPTAVVTLQELTITGGRLTGQDGAGVWANAPLVVDRVRFTDNRSSGADAEGGALRLQQGGTITNSVVVDNAANNAGGIYSVGNLTLTRTAVVDNTAVLTGGLHAQDLFAYVSTISDNTSTGSSAGAVEADDAVLRHTTISRNSAASGNRRQLYLLGNLAAQRSAVTDAIAGTSNCIVAGVVTSQGYNYASDQTCGFTNGTDVPANGNTGIGAAADNGGGTLTAAPSATGPLIDAIPSAACDATYTTDQRGTTRPQGDGCDIGAMEVLFLPPPPPPVTTCDGRPVTVNLAMGQVPTAGADVIRGTNGPDDVDGLGGNDRFCGLEGADTFDGGAGSDRAFGGRGIDVLRGQGGNDLADGGAGNDRLFGQNGRDALRGASGRDLADGGPGNDNLNGGSHRDTCRGGPGADAALACEVRIALP